MLSLDDLIAQTRTIGDINLQFLFLLFLLLIEHHLIGVQTGLTLGVASLGRHAHPLQLTLEGLTALGSRFLLLCQSLTLLFEP